ncbi:hypothetical protein ACFLXA_02290 [Chloroflexota bacterium]
MKAIAMRIRSGFMKAITAVTRGKTARRIRGGLVTAMATITRGGSMKAVAMIVLGLMATASLVVIIIFGVRISNLASSASGGIDSSDVTFRAEAADMSSEAVARLMPVAQALAGDSFVVQGTADLPPGTTAVTITGIDINLNENTESKASAEASGWAFTRQYTSPDNITSEAFLSDNSGNIIVFFATTPSEYKTPSDPSDFVVNFALQYSSMLALLGYDVGTSSSISGNYLQTITATQEDAVVEIRVWIDHGDASQVNIAVLKSTPEDISTAAADFANFAALLGGA